MTGGAGTPATPSDPGGEELHAITESDQDTSGGMGVSSETEGPTGPGQYGTTGVRDVGPARTGQLDRGEVRPEQSRGGVEINPDPPIPPKAGYNSHDPRWKDHPYKPTSAT